MRNMAVCFSIKLNLIVFILSIYMCLVALAISKVRTRGFSCLSVDFQDNHLHVQSMIISVSQIVKRWISIADDLTWRIRLVRTSRTDNLTLLLLSSGSVFADWLLLDLQLTEKHVTLIVFNLHLLIHVAILFHIVKLTDSPIRGIVIPHLFLIAKFVRKLRVLSLIAT